MRARRLRTSLGAAASPSVGKPQDLSTSQHLMASQFETRRRDAGHKSLLIGVTVNARNQVLHTRMSLLVALASGSPRSPTLVLASLHT